MSFKHGDRVVLKIDSKITGVVIERDKYVGKWPDGNWKKLVEVDEGKWRHSWAMGHKPYFRDHNLEGHWALILEEDTNIIQESRPPSMVVKIDYYQEPCSKCGSSMKALWRLDSFYCPNGCK